MTLEELIKNRQSLNYEQETALVEVLTRGCRVTTKQKIKAVIQYSFYSSFEGKSFAGRFHVTEFGITFNAAQSYSEELAFIRKELLK